MIKMSINQNLKNLEERRSRISTYIIVCGNEESVERMELELTRIHASINSLFYVSGVLGFPTIRTVVKENEITTME